MTSRPSPDILRDPARLLAARPGDPARPAVTYLDAASGERTELSARTLDNWVAKTAHLLVDDLDLGPGASIGLRLPPHWQGLVWLLACLTVRAEVVIGPSEHLDLVVTGPADGAAVPGAGAPPDGGAGPDGAGHVALALRPLAVPGPPPPRGIVDYDREVRAHGDHFVPSGAGDPHASVLRSPSRSWTSAELGEAVRGRAARWSLTPEDRVATGAGTGSVDEVVGGLAVLATGGALVLVRPGANPRPDGNLRPDGNPSGSPFVSLLSTAAAEGVSAFAPGLLPGGAGDPAPAGTRLLPAVD